MTVATYSTPGSFTWTCPSGVASAVVEVWGGGGKGGDDAADGAGGGGGGGGAYAKSTVAVSAGDYAVVVGASQQNSSFGTTTVVAAKGTNGGASPSGSGGAGGTTAGSTGDTKYAGGAGSGAAAGYSGAGGEGARTNATGGAASGSTGGSGGDGGDGADGVTTGNGSAGNQTGGGGSGGFWLSGGGKVGGAGGAGKVVITYTEPPATNANAGLAAGTGTAYGATASVKPNAGTAAGTGAAYGPPIKYAPAGSAAGTGAAYGATASVGSVAGVATGTGAAYTRLSYAPDAGVASATGTAYGVTVAPQPPRWACPPEYVVELFDSSATFGPNVKLAELWDLRNLGWSRYDRMPGRGFFTLYQDSPHLASIIPITTHVRVTRVAPSGNVEVFNGIVSDYNSTGDDVVFDIYDYVSLLSLSRSGYRTLYPTKLIGTEIVDPEWDLAKAATNSGLGFVTTGTIEDPLGADDATAIKTNAQFGLMDQMRLALFYDMTEMGRANTNHHVTFEITRTAPFTFNFWKNKGSLVGIPLVLNGSVSEYQHAPNWAAYRNDLATLGTTVGGGVAEVVKADATSAAAYGLRQGVFTIKTLAGATGAVETDQQQAVAARFLKEATEGSPALWLTLVPGVIQPFSGFDICDTMPVEIVNGADSITGNWRVVGARAIVDEPGERMQLLVAKVIT